MPGYQEENDSLEDGNIGGRENEEGRNSKNDLPILQMSVVCFACFCEQYYP